MNRFTNEQVLMLSQNPYTYSVNRERLFLTKEFKEIFYAKYQAGEIPRQILADHGYAPEVLGKVRIWGISAHIKKEYKKYESFKEGYTPSRSTKTTSLPPKSAASEKDELKHLQHELDYLKQEVAFLKKISSIRTMRK